ncbi:glycosyltransferase [Lactiplantibacillus mudanjiangensis]|uniref:glycosyltransferase n=1 Tax=Lactiplantibacillus mudanjiangensis TaxID=1296538 RepID=UPI0013EEFFB6
MKISVIAPVYNVFEYLDKSVKSLLAQTLTDIEILLVNDGSTDGSLQKITELAKLDSRIKVLSQPNSGAAAARNNGLSKAKGKYCYFMDPDDWIESDMLEKMYSRAENVNAQLVITGFTNEYYVKGKTFTTTNSAFDVSYLSKLDFRDNAYKLFNNTLIAVPWNKLYLTQFLKENNLKFPKIKWDDLHFNMEVIKNIEKVSVINYVGYHFFRTRPGSETTMVFDDNLFSKRREQFTHILSVFSHWNMLDRDFMSAIYYYYSCRLVQVIQGISSNSKFSKSEKRTKVRQILYDELTVRSLKGEKSNSLAFSILFIPMRKKWCGISIMFGKILSGIQKRFNLQFQKIRVNLTTKRI